MTNRSDKMFDEIMKDLNLAKNELREANQNLKQAKNSSITSGYIMFLAFIFGVFITIAIAAIFALH